MKRGFSSDRQGDSAELEIERTPGRAGCAGWLAARLSRIKSLPAWARRCVLLLVVYAAIAGAFAGAVGVSVRLPFLDLLYQIGSLALLTYALAALAYYVSGALGARATADHFRRLLLSPAFFFEVTVALLVVCVAWMITSTLRQLVPEINPWLYDSPLWRLDVRLHLGLEPSIATHEFFAREGLLWLVDQAQFVIFPLPFLVPLLFLLSRRLRPRRGELFVAYGCLLMAGSLASMAWPSLGPVYYWPTRFTSMWEATDAQHLQGILMQDYLAFREQAVSAVLASSPGLAAFPSLEVGMLSLFAIASSRWRAVSMLLWTITALTFVGSLALGWHYAVDGYAGALLACGAWWVGTKLGAKRV